MRIVKHKNVDLTAEEIMDIVRSEKCPMGISVNVTDDTIICEPEGKCNLFGEIDDEYETIYYSED